MIMESNKTVTPWQPTKGDVVGFSVYIENCVPGGKPIASYTGRGLYLGECADGHMTRATECTKPDNIGEIIYTRRVSQVSQ